MAGKYVSRYTGQEIDEGIRKANEADALPLRGGAMKGPLTVLEPTEGAHAASKAYVDGLLGNVAEALDGINGEVV